MRIAALIISWILWLIAALYWLFLLFVSFRPELLPTIDPEESFDRLFLYTGIGSIVVAYALWYVRRRIWFDAERKVGIGFLVFLFPLYFTVMCAVVGPYLEYIIWGQQTLFLKTGFCYTIALMILVFPRLPKAESKL